MLTSSTYRNTLAPPAWLRLARAFLLALLLLPGSAWAQLTGPKSVPGTYATLAAAIADLNAQGVGAGGVTFNIAAGYTETFGSPTAGLITLNSSSANAGSATRPIVFQKAGSGANPLITAGVGTGASDAIIAVAGTDYVSFISIDVAENAANTTPATQMEAGYALYRASATDGSQYVQVAGATITLNRANTNSVGILSAPTTAAGVAVVTTSDVTGSNNNNKFNGNTVTNAFVGISVLGSTGGAGYPDYYTEIGTTTGNVLSGLGGSDVSAYGIRCEQQLGPKIENNTVSILAGNLTTPVCGIRMDGLLIGAVLINNNTVTITSATTATVAGIWQASSYTQSGFPTRGVSNNKIQNCVLTGTGSGDVYYIREDSRWSSGGCSISNNQITGNTAATAGGVYGIYKTTSMNSLSVSGNTISNNVKSGESNPSTSGPAGFLGIYCSTGAFYGTYNNNVITNNQVTAANSAVLYGMHCSQSGSSDQAMNGNTVSGNQVQAANCQLYGIGMGLNANSSSVPGTTLNNNVLRNNAATLAGGTATVYGIYCPAGGSRNDNIDGNTVTGLTITGTGGTTNVLTGIYGLSTNFSSRSVSQNTVGDLTLGGAGLSLSGIVKGMDVSFSGACRRNKAYGLLAGGAAAKVYGLFINGAIDINNNLIGDLKAPDATGLLAITGLYLGSNPTTNVFYNTVYLNASSTGATFGTTALYVDGRANNGGLVLRNNILVNTSTAAGAGGYTVAFRWVNSGGMPFVYAGDRNDLYAGQPSATNLLYVGGTATGGTITSVVDAKQTLADYKAFMAAINREQGSVAELPPFLSTIGSSAGFLHIDPSQYTQVSNAGLANSFFTTDYDGDLRSTTTPDIGADEYTSPGQDVGITALVQPGNGGCAGCNQPVEVIIRNFGSSATTLPVPVQVVVTAPGGATQTLSSSYASPIAAGGSANLVVGNLAVASSGSYGFVATTTYSNDPVASNNSFSTIVNLAFANTTAWTGAISDNWFTAGNWTAGVPTATLDATINSGPTYSSPFIGFGTATVRNLTLGGFHSIRLNRGILNVKGDFLSNGMLFDDTGSLLLFDGTGPQVFGGTGVTVVNNLSIGAAGVTLAAPCAVLRVLTLAGNLTSSTATPLTLESSTAGDALVVNSGGVVVGPAIVKRAIYTNGVTTTSGYRHYSAPVSNSTVSDLDTGTFTPVVNPAYNTAAVPDLVRPFPTVFGYDDSRLTLANNTRGFDKGFFSPATLNDPLAVGRGYTVNIPANERVDFRGTLNNGDLPLALTSTRPTYPDGGWQLLGNPYPAPLNYALVDPADRAGLEAAIYVYSSTSQYAGRYRSYVNGIGNPVLPIGQGFFARIAAGLSSATMTFRNSQRLTVPDATAFLRPTADPRPLVQLTLQASGGVLADEATVYFENGATSGFEPAFDAEKLPNPTGLNLSTSQAGHQLSIDGQPELGVAQRVVPLAVGVPAAGVYTFTATQLLNLNTVPVYLRDLQLGTLTDLRQQPTYQFTISNAAALNTSRFELVFSPQQALATVPAALAQQVALYPNPAKTQVAIELPLSLSRQPVTAALLDALGRVVRQQVLPAGLASHTLPLATVAPGVYSLRLTTEQGTITKKLVVD